MSLPISVQQAVLVPSVAFTGEKIKGYDFNEGVDYSALFSSFKFTGLQASNLALAIEEINRMASPPLLSLGPLSSFPPARESGAPRRDC